jgi:hypothetical protein
VFIAEENTVCTLKRPGLTAKKWKKKSFYEEKSLVGSLWASIKVKKNNRLIQLTDVFCLLLLINN